jgi:hypothetical protein
MRFLVFCASQDIYRASARSAALPAPIFLHMSELAAQTVPESALPLPLAIISVRAHLSSLVRSLIDLSAARPAIKATTVLCQS